MNSRTKITEKDTLGQTDLVEKFVHSDVRKMNVFEKFVHNYVRKMNDSRQYLVFQISIFRTIKLSEFSFFILVQTVSQFFALHIGISTE